jgi:hypothetical protein
MKLDVEALAKEVRVGPQEDVGEDDDLANEGLGVAADEIMDAFQRNDRESLIGALRNFIAMARD